jgi:hypothetical protein
MTLTTTGAVLPIGQCPRSIERVPTLVAVVPSDFGPANARRQLQGTSDIDPRRRQTDQPGVANEHAARPAPHLTAALGTTAD